MRSIFPRQNRGGSFHAGLLLAALLSVATPAMAQDEPAGDAPAEAAPEATPAPAAKSAAPTPAPAAVPAPEAAPASQLSSSTAAPKRLSLKGPAPTVAIAVEGTDPGTRDQVNRVETELAAALQRDGRILPASSTGAPEASAPNENADVAKHLKAAQDAYSGLDLDAATKEYAEAIKAAFTQPESADPEMVAKTFVAMGAAYQLNGDRPHADAAFRFALALRPQLQPDASLYDYNIRGAFDAQRRALDAAATSSPSTVDVDVEGPAGAEVTVDGNPAGSAPVRGFKVWPGRHLVVAKSPGYLAKAAVGMAQPGEGGEVKIALEETPEHQRMSGARERALSERRLPAPGPGISELAQKSSAQAVLVGALSSSAEGTRIELTLFDARGGRRLAAVSREAVVEGSHFGSALDGLALELGNDWIDPPDDGLANEPSASKPIYRRWYFWAGVGVAVAAGAAATYVATQPSPHLPFGTATALGLP